MNVVQRMILVICAIATALMSLFPPWNFVYDFPGDDFYVNRPAYKAERFAGYYAIWKSNAPTDQSQLAALFSIPADQRSSLQYFSIRLNTTRLLVQFTAILLLTVILTILSKSPHTSTRRYRDE
jgi:hypothetical protein